VAVLAGMCIEIQSATDTVITSLLTGWDPCGTVNNRTLECGLSSRAGLDNSVEYGR
jgi:hypothetical protein